MRQLPFGTAQRDVLLKLTSPWRSAPSWSLKDGTALYESRALTDAICQGLVRHGYLNESPAGSTVIYTVTEDGHRRADELRGGL